MPNGDRIELNLAVPDENSEENVKKKVEEMKKAANAHYMKQKYQLALAGYNNMIEICPDDAGFYGNRAACYMMLGQYQKAFEDAKTSVKLDPDCCKTYIRLVKCALILGYITTARYELDRLLNLNPATIKIQEEKEKLEYLENHFKRAEDAYDAGRYREAIFELRLCSSISTACTKIKVRMAECWVLLEEYQHAEDSINNLLHLDRQNVDALYIRGMCLYYQDNIDKGIAYFQQVLRLAPDHKGIKVYKTAKTLKLKKETGDAAFKMDNYQLAYNSYTEALTVDPKNRAINAKLYFNRANSAKQLGLTEECVKDCTSALDLNPNYTKALLLRSKCYMLLKEYDWAVKDLDKVCRLDTTTENVRKLAEAKALAARQKRKDYYGILGIGERATLNDVKKAYKLKARQHHPDRHAVATEIEQKEQEIKFKEILEAYNVLSDPVLRLRYDRSTSLSDMYQSFFN